jgi:hypothetical protein
VISDGKKIESALLYRFRLPLQQLAFSPRRTTAAVDPLLTLRVGLSCCEPTSELHHPRIFRGR